MDGEAAVKLHAQANEEGGAGLTLRGNRLVVNWARARPLPEELRLAIDRGGATRHLFVGGIDNTVTYSMLEGEFSQFGEIESMRILPVLPCPAKSR